MKSVMHDFSLTPSIKAPRSMFRRNFGHKTTMDSGWLVPVMWDSILPGDTINLNMTAMARLATPKFPLMDNMYLDTHFFFVPTRLIWENFRKFCGEQEDPGASIDYTIPILTGAAPISDADGDLTTTNGRISVLLNYLGVPQDIAPDDVDISALPYRAYSRIYSEWFRDQNIIDSTNLSIDDGPDNVGGGTDQVLLQRRGKRFDYFTQALPWPQKGDAVSIPIGTVADVVTTGTDIHFANSSDSDFLMQTSAIDTDMHNNASPQASVNIQFGDPTGLETDLSSATASTVNDLREAFQVQRLLERDARSGTRYSELVKNHFGVQFYDSSYRPEYLGGGSQRIGITPVPATTELTRNVGDLGAYGVSVGSNHGFTKSFVEHGIIMGIVSIRADLTYQQGLNRHFSHSTRYDYYWPSLAHLGEQSLMSKELFCDGSAGDNDVFGYVPRYDEYRHKPSQISGKFMSLSNTPLDSWHLSQEFLTRPTLSQTFIEENPPLDRVIQVDTEPHFILDTYFDYKHARCIPTFGTPGLIDHF